MNGRIVATWRRRYPTDPGCPGVSCRSQTCNTELMHLTRVPTEPAPHRESLVCCETMRRNVLTRMACHFFSELSLSSGISSNDIEIADYLKGRRTLKNFILRPIIVKRNRHTVPSPHLIEIDESKQRMLVGFSLIEGRYEIEFIGSDYRAERILDALDASRAFVTRNTERNLSLIGIDEGDLPDTRILPQEKFVNLCSRQLGVHLDNLRFSGILDGFSYQTEFDLLVWQLADTVYDDDVLIYALLFFREALYSLENTLDVHAAPESISDAPISISESVKLENAIHNFYKVVEAIYGGTLANDARKVQSRFLRRGVNTAEVVGFPQLSNARETIFDKISKLQAARDERAAHGRVHANRKGSYFEVMDAMELAHHLIVRFVEHTKNIHPLALPRIMPSFANTRLSDTNTDTDSA